MGHITTNVKTNQGYVPKTGQTNLEKAQHFKQV